MKEQYKYFKCNKSVLRWAMYFFLQFWLAALVAVSIALGSPASGETSVLTIETIECEGNQSTSCEYVKAQTNLKEGEPLEDEKVRESQLRLELLGYFDEVSIRLSKGSEPGKTKLTISVHEGSAYSLSGSLTASHYGPSALTFADVSGVNRNFSGHGDVLSLRVRNNYLESFRSQTYARAEYTRPNFFFPRAYFSVGLAGGHQRTFSTYYTYDAYNVYLGPANIYEAWADVALGYKLFDYSFITAGYRHFIANDYSSVFVQTGWDSQDNSNFPTQGSRFTLSMDFYNYPYTSNYYFASRMVGSLSYRKHWELVDSHILTLQIGRPQNGTDPAFYLYEEQPLFLRYTYQFKRHATSDFVQNGAVFVEPGVGFGFEYMYSAIGLKLGTTLETKYCLVNLALLAWLR